jgi:hypothetical protein
MVEVQIREEIGNLAGQIANGEPSLIPWAVEEPEEVES